MALSRNSEVARQNARSVKEQVLEAAAVGAVGAALGAGAGTLVGLTGPAAAVAASNGAISGFRQIYEWTSRKVRGIRPRLDLGTCNDCGVARASTGWDAHPR